MIGDTVQKRTSVVSRVVLKLPRKLGRRIVKLRSRSKVRYRSGPKSGPAGPRTKDKDLDLRGLYNKFGPPPQPPVNFSHLGKIITLLYDFPLILAIKMTLRTIFRMTFRMIFKAIFFNHDGDLYLSVTAGSDQETEIKRFM